MAAADRGAMPDLYQLLGVPREASREQIAQAWRRRARTEHPDRRPAEAGEEASGRFRVLAEAYQVLADPARRAAYDRALERPQPAPQIIAPAVRIPVRHVRGPEGPGPLPRASAAPLRAGPVRIEGRHPVPGGADERESQLALLTELAWRFLARDRDWPW